MQSDDEDDDNEYIFGMQSDEEEEDEEEMEKNKKKKIKGGADEELEKNLEKMHLKNPSPFQKRIEERDPDLIIKNIQGKYKPYSRSCLTHRQPVIIDDIEKDIIDREHPNSYSSSVKFGTKPDKKYWYICPRYWSFKTNTSLTEEEVQEILKKNPKAIIPPKSKTIPKGSFIYEFNDHQKEHINDKGEYIVHHPGFIKDSHPNGFNVPCCYKKQKKETENEQEKKGQKEPKKTKKQEKPEEPKEPEESEEPKEPEESEEVEEQKKLKKQEELEEQEELKETNKKKIKITKTQKENLYVIGPSSFPIAKKRFGFLPTKLQEFFNIDYTTVVSKENTAIIKPNKSCLLRNGVEHHKNQSILGCFAYAYSYEKNTEIQSTTQIRETIVNGINIDQYIKYNNGSLASIFRSENDTNFDETLIKKYENNDFLQIINKENKEEMELFKDLIISFENFTHFLKDETSIIDHTYIWDIFTQPNKNFFENGINLVIFELSEDDTLQIICPVNAYHYKLFDENKKTLLLLKQKEFYEPICYYSNKNNSNKVIKIFEFSEISDENLTKSFKEIKEIVNKRCSPKPSIPTFYGKQNISALETFEILQKNNYIIKTQIINLQSKTIGFIVSQEEEDMNNVFVPCFPSPILDELQFEFIYDEQIWNNYYTTIRELTKIHKISGEKIKCLPKFKIIDDKNKIIGLMTETNQYIKIKPPINDENLMLSNHIKSSDLIDVDIDIHDGDYDYIRVNIVKRIKLENYYYTGFKNIVKSLLAFYENRHLKQQIIELINNTIYNYEDKINKIKKILKVLTKNHVIFENTSDFVNIEKAEMKIITQLCDGDDCPIIIPKTNLFTNIDNEEFYFLKITDELVRYNRTRKFLLEPKKYFNLSNIDYDVKNDEILIMDTSLKNGYFANLKMFNPNGYEKNIVYENAEPDPAISQHYENRIMVNVK